MAINYHTVLFSCSKIFRLMSGKVKHCLECLAAINFHPETCKTCLAGKSYSWRLPSRSGQVHVKSGSSAWEYLGILVQKWMWDHCPVQPPSFLGRLQSAAETTDLLPFKGCEMNGVPLSNPLGFKTPPVKGCWYTTTSYPQKRDRDDCKIW